MVTAPDKVTPETFIRAETDRMFSDIQKLCGKINTFYHYRQPTPLDKQTVIRMNRDTLYSGAIIDTDSGATVTMPKIPDGRYASILIIDNDHYCPAVFYDPGTHQVPAQTRFMFAALRIQIFNPEDADEVALVNRLQDQFTITASSAAPFVGGNWDRPSLDALRAKYERDAAGYTGFKGMMGPKGKVDEASRHIAAAAGWGLFPDQDAIYLNFNDPGDISVGQTATYHVPENKGFWSITVYGKDGYIKSEASTIRSVDAKLNADGTFTAYFGSVAQCGDVPNRVDAPEGWNFLMRVYRPGLSVLDGTYKLPKVKPYR